MFQGFKEIVQFNDRGVIDTAHYLDFCEEYELYRTQGSNPTNL